MKSIQVKIGVASGMPDLTCRDGEVERFSNVDWLQKLADEAEKSNASSASKPSPNPDNENGNADDTDSSNQPSSLLNLQLTGQPVSLPYGATLLAIHTPPALAGEKRYLFLNQNYSLGIAAPDGSTQILIADTYNTPGDIKSVACHDDFIFIAARKGMIRLVYNADNGNYSVPSTLPSAPEVTFTFAPTILPDYVNTAGDYPLITVEIPVSPADNISETTLSNWFNRGSGTAVNTNFKSTVYKAVGKAVEKYIAEARRRQIFLSSAGCIAAYGTHLPGEGKVISYSTGESDPCARLASWGLYENKIILTLYLTLPPLSLTAIFFYTKKQYEWARYFPTLDLYVSSEAPIFPVATGALEAIAYTSYTHPVSGDKGYAFRFPTFTVAEKKRLAEKLTDYRLVKSVPVKTAASAALKPLPADPSAKIFVPDYSDFNDAMPEKIVATDQGFVLFGGEASLASSVAGSRSVSLHGAVLSSVPDFPFLLRNFTRVSDGKILDVAMASGARSAASTGRHPLHVLSTDGIRLLNTDGNGGYLNSRLISTLAAASSLTARYADLTYFFSHQGLHTLSMASAIKSLDIPVLTEEWEQMEVVGRNEALLLRSPGRTSLIDLDKEILKPLPDISLRRLSLHDGNLYSLSPAGNLIRVSLILDKTADSSVDPIFDSETQSRIVAANPAGRADTRYADILTRPLKFGNPFRGTRLRGVKAATPDVYMILEGSSDLLHWFEIARGYGILFPLRLPAIPFYRLRART
ncbi:MAG: hypothetical protein K2H35_07950, partial [Muribaculaceae bacterium]|nr:hypothetical protein [Muribaculaceae bacterium]